jgi:hypothetical protein
MKPLVIKCYVDKDASAKYRSLIDAKKEMNRGYPTEFIIEEIDMSDFKWEIRNFKYYISDETVFKYSQQVKQEHGNKVDKIVFCVDKDNWKNTTKRLRGFKLGRIFDTYRVGAVKFRKGYEQTFEHEIGHAVDDFILYYTAINVAHLLGVKDFDQDIVHYDGYQEHYDYDDVWKAIAPHLSKAIERRRLSVLNIFDLKLLIEQLKQQLVWNSNSIQEPTNIWDELKYFKKSEFRYPEKISRELLLKLDSLREKVGFPIGINSDWRPTGSHVSSVDIDLEIDGGVFYTHLKTLYKKGAGSMIWHLVNYMVKDAQSMLYYKDDKQFIATKNAIELGFTRIGLYDSHMHIGLLSEHPQNVVWTGKSE